MFGKPVAKPQVESPESLKKIEQCIVDVMGQGKDKATAIKICKSSMMKSKKPANKVVATMAKTLKQKLGK